MHSLRSMIFQLISLLIFMIPIGVGALEDNHTVDVFNDPSVTYTGLGGPARGLFVACVVGLTCTTLLVVNRLYWRWKLSGGFGYDDWAIILAHILLITQSAIMFVAINNGYGTASKYILAQDKNDLDGPGHNDVRKVAFYFFLYQIFYKLTINFVKISVLCLYVRLFPPLWIRLVSFIGIVVSFLAIIAFTSTTLFQCVPIQCIYDPWYASDVAPFRVDVLAFWKAHAFWNIASDAIIIVIPLFMIRTMKILSIGRRVTMGVTFSFGLIVIVAAVLRFTTLNTKNMDLTSGTYTSTLWTQIESALAVSSACFPMLRQTLEICFPELRERQIDRNTWQFLSDAPAPPTNFEMYPMEPEQSYPRSYWEGVEMPAERIGHAF